MARYYGQNADFGLGDESGGSYRTAASRTNWIRHAVATPAENFTQAFAETLQWVGGAPVTPPRAVQSDPTLALEFDGAYDFMGPLFEALAGAAGSSSGAGPYDHTYTPATVAKAPGKYYTIELDLADSGNSRLYLGSCLNTLGITIPNRGKVRFTTEWIVGSVDDPASAGSPTYEAVPLPRIYADQLSSVTWNGITLTSDELMGSSINFNNNLQRLHALNGTIFTNLPHYGQEGRSATASLEVMYGSTIADAFSAGYKASTQSDLVFTFGGTGNYAMVATLRNAFLTANALPPMSRPDIVPYTAQFAARSDETDPLWEIVISNDSSSAIANT